MNYEKKLWIERGITAGYLVAAIVVLVVFFGLKRNAEMATKALAACQQENADLKGKLAAVEKKRESDAEWALRICLKRGDWAIEQACRCSKRCEPDESPTSECSQMVVGCEKAMWDKSFEKALGVEEAPR